jgi:FtsZ-binding cell division protein ZapB
MKKIKLIVESADQVQQLRNEVEDTKESNKRLEKDVFMVLSENNKLEVKGTELEQREDKEYQNSINVVAASPDAVPPAIENLRSATEYTKFTNKQVSHSFLSCPESGNFQQNFKGRWLPSVLLRRLVW